MKLAEKGIIFIDEIDKIGSTGEGAVNTTRVQAELLKMIEGAEVKVCVNENRQNPQYEYMNTKNILFVCAGAFAGLQEAIQSSQGGINITGSLTPDSNSWQEKVTTDNLSKFGMMPELLGRLPVLAFTNSLSVTELTRVFTEPKNSLVEQYQELFSVDDVTVEFDEELLKNMAERCIKNKIGVRGLKALMEKELKDISFNIDQYAGSSIRVSLNGIETTRNRKRFGTT